MKRILFFVFLIFVCCCSAAEAGAKNSDKSIAGKIGNCVIYRDPQTDLVPEKTLTPEQMVENFEVLVKAIDQYYSFFIHKNIEWEKICGQYREKLKKTRSTRSFYKLLYEFVRQLEDAHSRLENHTITSELPIYAPPISFRNIEGKVVAVDVWLKSKAYRYGVRPGWVLVRVNRKPVSRYMELLKKYVPVCSSERNLTEKTSRMILCGKKSSNVQLDFLTPTGQTVKGLVFARSIRYPVTTPDPPLKLTKIKTIKYGKHSDIGYIQIPTFKGRMELADEFDQALELLRNTSRLLIDIRDNPGGYGTCQKRIIGRFLTVKKRGITSYGREGIKHDDFTNNLEFISPSGKWQYTKPVGLLMNSVTGSAADLFAARCMSTGRVVSMGQTTHGNLTGRGVYAVLPCKLVVRISNGYIADASGKIIEGNGNKPKIIIEPTIIDAQKQVDGVLVRAFKELARI